MASLQHTYSTNFYSPLTYHSFAYSHQVYYSNPELVPKSAAQVYNVVCLKATHNTSFLSLLCGWANTICTIFRVLSLYGLIHIHMLIISVGNVLIVSMFSSTYGWTPTYHIAYHILWLHAYGWTQIHQLSSYFFFASHHSCLSCIHEISD